MKEMLEELLSEYQKKYDTIKGECIELMKAGKPWIEHTKPAAGLKMMIDHLKQQLSNYQSR